MSDDYPDYLASKNTLFDNNVHDNRLATKDLIIIIINKHLKSFTFGIRYPLSTACKASLFDIPGYGFDPCVTNS